jgi:hypothetical protein
VLTGAAVFGLWLSVSIPLNTADEDEDEDEDEVEVEVEKIGNETRRGQAGASVGALSIPNISDVGSARTVKETAFISSEVIKRPLMKWTGFVGWCVER